jgi:hypothetical protein
LRCDMVKTSGSTINPLPRSCATELIARSMSLVS